MASIKSKRNNQKDCILKQVNALNSVIKKNKIKKRNREGDYNTGGYKNFSDTTNW